MLKKIFIADAQKVQTPTGKTYLEISEQGGQRFSCWVEELWPALEAAQGQELEVEIVYKGQFVNIVGVAGVETKSYAPRQNKSEQIRQAQDTKARYIAEAQDRKDDSIAYFNSLNNAIVFLSATKGTNFTLDEVYLVQNLLLERWIMRQK